jgi:AraC-like DNA-binding protein
MPALLLSSRKAETLLQRYSETTRRAAQGLTQLTEGILRGDLKNVPSLLIDAQASLARTGKDESRIFLRYLESALGCSFLSSSPADAEAPDFWPQGWKGVFNSPLWDRWVHPPVESKNGDQTDQESVARSIKAYLQRHGFEGITLAKAARDLGFTPNYLSFLFHRQTGTTFTEYITELRLQRARELLWSGKSVKESAWAVGYGSERHFARLYRHRFGCSPGADKQNRGNLKKS